MTMIVTALSNLKAGALVTTMIAAGAAGVPAVHALPHAQAQTQAHRLTTEQMYRNYMQSGSVFYGPHSSGPPAHVVAVTKSPMRQAIQHEARVFSGLPPRPS